MDTDKSPRLGSRYEVEALPTLILFHEGKVCMKELGFYALVVRCKCECVTYTSSQVLERFIGYRTADVLEAEIRKVPFLF